MRRFLPLLAVVAGCERDPTFFGYWDIDRAARGDVVQDDVGFLEILEDGQVAVFVRYAWDGDGFSPDPQPSVEIGATDAVAQEPLGNYHTKGETYALTLEPFAATFDVADYRGDRAELTAGSAEWPTGVPGPAPTTLHLVR